MEVTINRRWFSSLPPIKVEIGAEFENAREGIKLGAAVKVLVGKAAEQDTRANLTDANLTRADLTDANLTRANLTRADLTSLPKAALRPIRADLFDVLLRARSEVPALLRALREGRIDGSTYNNGGDCRCLAGTIAQVRGCDYTDLGFADSERPIERWFYAIRPGNKPDNHPVAKMTEGWIIEFMSLAGIEEASAA
ncbi:MAG TPA: pentapeptide repeat-containing protein [Beijerinckiaceae bacterium]|nr:pentapeptide repeat-containing protein [Beijerinckiaceae bacterium]